MHAADDATRDWGRLARRWWVVLTLSLLGFELFLALDWTLLAGGRFGAPVNPPGLTFTVFWSASWLALHGHAADAYQLAALFPVERAALPSMHHPLAWFYPPPFYLLVLPLALLPYWPALACFMLGSLTAFVLALRRQLRGAAWLGLLAAPALWDNLLVGQNGLLTAALGTAGLLLLPRAPLRAGMLIGLLVIKPQLALLFPLALLAVGAWSVLLAAGLTALSLGALALAVFGQQTWLASLGGAHAARQFLESPDRSWGVMPSTFAMLRLQGAPLELAYAAQAAVALVCAAAVWRVWRRCPDPGWRAATLLAATPLVSPYMFHYDLAWLAFPLLWNARAGLRDGWHRGEPALLLAAWLLPLLLLVLGHIAPLAPGPLVLALLLWNTVRRAMDSATAAR